MSKLLANEKRRIARVTASDDEGNGGAPVASKTAAKPATAEGDDVVEGDDAAEGDEEKPKGKAKAKAKVVVPDDEEGAPSAAIAERVRCRELSSLSAQAARLNVAFDATAAIAVGMSVDAARAAIMDAVALGDADDTSAIAAPKTKVDPAGKTMDATAKSAAWKKAMTRR